MRPILERMRPGAPFLRLVMTVIVSVALVSGCIPPDAKQGFPYGPGSPLRPPAPDTGTTTSPTTTPPTTTPPTTTTAPTTLGEPWFGVLEPTPARLGEVRAAGVAVAHISISWRRMQPASGGDLDPDTLTYIRNRYTELRTAGFAVVLDTGMQYPPDWVFEEGARFVNQYGDPFVGGLGEDVADGVFDMRVRDAQAAYLARLGAALADFKLLGARVSGLPYGELRYPEPDYAGRSNSYWAFSPPALAASPVPEWRPGDPDIAAAETFLRWYLSSLTDYGTWLTARHREAFPDTTLHVLMPSWGVRPGEIEAAVAAGLDGSSRGERRETINQGLDWAAQVPAVAAVGNVAVSSTWMDAADQGTDPVYESPLRHLVRIADPLGVPVLGENTGGNDEAAMARSVARVRELGLVGMLWMKEPELFTPGLATLADYRRLIANG